MLIQNGIPQTHIKVNEVYTAPVNCNHKYSWYIHVHVVGLLVQFISCYQRLHLYSCCCYMYMCVHVHNFCLVCCVYRYTDRWLLKGAFTKCTIMYTKIPQHSAALYYRILVYIVQNLMSPSVFRQCACICYGPYVQGSETLSVNPTSQSITIQCKAKFHFHCSHAWPKHRFVYFK